MEKSTIRRRDTPQVDDRSLPPTLSSPTTRGEGDCLDFAPISGPLPPCGGGSGWGVRFRRSSVLLLLFFLGCSRPEGDRLVVATPWPATERAAIESAFREQVPTAGPVTWVALATGDDPARLVPKLGVDVVLGIPGPALDALATSNSLIPIDPSDSRPWRIARRSALGLAVRSSRRGAIEGSALDDRSFDGSVALDDPRRDPLALAWAKARLSAGGYGEVVKSAANAVRIGRGGTTLERVRRGEADVGPTTGIEGAIDDHTNFVPIEGAPAWIEGVAIVAGAKREAEARSFVAFLGDRGQAQTVTKDESPASATMPDALLGDLLGATLVDAQDELWTASDSLDRADRPAELVAFLNDPPPWPPTSVAKLRERADPLPLLETLAREISDDPDARFWLLATWDRSARKIDAAWLREAAGAAEGRLIAEPRFRTWLRGEWTAWARQHYRRIAREARKVAE
jgi:hypothetical protein